MLIIISSLANIEIAAQAALATGVAFRCICFLSEASDIQSSLVPIECFTDMQAHREAVVAAIREVGGKAIYFSTAAADPVLRYDMEMSQLVREAGGIFIGQNPYTVLASCNKLITRELAAEAGFTTTNAYKSHPEIQLDGRLIVAKHITGAGGIGQKILRAQTATQAQLQSFPQDYYFEDFVHGIEISASVFANGQRFWLGPIAVKGWTGEENLHATEKLRAIYPHRFAALEAYLEPLCKKLAIGLRANGWLDIEFIMTQDQIYFLEVNPRFSCLTRLNFFATGLNPFWVMLSPNWPKIEKMQYAMEFPLRHSEDIRPNSSDVIYVHGASVSTNPRFKGKCVFSAADKEALYAKCKSLAPAYLENAPEEAEETALDLEKFLQFFLRTQ